MMMTANNNIDDYDDDDDRGKSKLESKNLSYYSVNLILPPKNTIMHFII